MATWPTITDDDGTGTVGTIFNLSFFDDIKAYIQAGSHQSGLDASKPGSPALGDVYHATDTDKLYACFTAGSWTDITKADSIEFTPAGDLAATDVQAAIEELDTEKVAKALFDANSILKADTNDTPEVLTIAEQRLVGRITAGDIAALTAAQVRTLLGLATADSPTFAGLTITDDIVLGSPAADGLHPHRIARGTYDFGVNGGAISTIGLGVSLPDNAIVVKAWYEVLTTLTSNTDAATIAIGIPTDDPDGIFPAIAITDPSNPWDAGNYEVSMDLSEKTTATREISMTIAVEALTAGKFVVWCEYVVSD